MIHEYDVDDIRRAIAADASSSTGKEIDLSDVAVKLDPSGNGKIIALVEIPDSIIVPAK